MEVKLSMFNQGKNSLIQGLMISVAASVVVVGSYHLMRSKSSGSFSAEQKQEIKNVMSGIVKENPEMFLSAMNDAAQKQQEKSRQEIEVVATQSKNDLMSASIQFGPNQNGDVRFVAVIDPMCPHCNEFQKIAFHVLKQRKDVTFHFLPVAVLGPNSEAMSKVMIGGSKQGTEKLRAFQEKFIDSIQDMSRKKLLELAKESGFDLAKLEKEELSEVTQKEIERNNLLAEKLKIQGVPTVFVVDANNQLKLIPPSNLEGFMQFIEDIKKSMDAKGGKEATQPPAVQQAVSKNNAAVESKSSVKKEDDKKTKKKETKKAA